MPRIIWYLLERPHRFADLLRSIEGVSANVPTSKLWALEREPPQVEYALTERGRAFEPVFRAMEEAASRLFPEPQPRRSDPRRPPGSNVKTPQPMPADGNTRGLPACGRVAMTSRASAPTSKQASP